MKVICFDLEGPLSPQDNAYEVLGSLPDGYKLFEVISRYDDLLVLEKRADYEPGDTLALIVPFLLYHNISTEDIERISARARIIPGARELMDELKERSWHPYVISTSYQQHAFSVGARLGIPQEDIFCTELPLAAFREELGGEDFSLVREMEKTILEELSGENDEKIKSTLDKFFWEELPQTSLGKIREKVKVRGGERKWQAVQEVGKRCEEDIGKMIVVGDSITDFRMLEEVKKAGGLAVVFNGNEYALPYGNVGLASDNMLDLLELIDAYEAGKVKERVKEHPRFQWLADDEREKTAELHKKFRSLMRGQAAKLG